MSKHIVIIAGEESGDKHAASLVKSLRNLDNQLKFTGIGGQHLQNENVELVSDLARFGVTGITEVLKHVRVIKKAYTAIKIHLEATKPDLLVLVDYPGFNLKLAQFAKKKLGLKIIYYISPQIWAWKANRIHKIKACVDKMAVIFPFEKAIYQKAAVPVSFVGHPLIAKLPPNFNLVLLRQNLDLPLNRPVVAILPGSRHNEIKAHMPVLAAMMQKILASNTKIHFVIPVADTISFKTIEAYLPNQKYITLLKGQALEAIALSDCALVASGTASLECALLGKPMCIFYKTSRLTYALAMQFIKVKYLGLCNLLAKKMIVPELIQDDFTVETLIKMIEELLTNIPLRMRIKGDLKAIKESLSSNKADCSLTELILTDLMG